MDYPIMVLPFGEKSFMDFSKAETEDFFHWFMDEIPVRLDVLKEFFLGFSGSKDIFNYQVESLDIIWKWYLENVVIEDVDPEEYQKKVMETPEHMRPYVPTKHLGSGWTQVAWDIGIYLALCLLEHNPILRWGVKTEPPNLATVNRPVILGFRNGGFEPFLIMMNISERVADGNSDETALSDLFNTWISFAPQNS